MSTITGFDPELSRRIDATHGAIAAVYELPPSRVRGVVLWLLYWQLRRLERKVPV